MSAGLQRVLVIDDDPDDALLVRRCLERNPLTAGCAVDHALGPERGLQMLASGAYDAGLLDYRLGATDGIAVLGLARARGLATPLVLMTGGGDEQVAVEAMKAGAVDYMAKSRMTPDSLAAALRYAASLGESRRRLAETERRFRRVFDQAIVGNVISTPAGRLLACNQALASMLGYATVAELQEVNAYDLYADRRRRDEYLDHLRAHGFVEGFECEFVRADGGRIRVVVHGAAIKDEQGALVETHASVLDVTAHVRAQQALRDSEERYRGLFEGNPLAIVVAEEESLRILAVNEAAVRQYGYSREEFARLVLLDLRPPEDAPAMLERFRATADAAVRFTSGRHVRKDGTVFEVEVEAHPIVFGGRRARAGVVTDVTERHRAERALRASEERFRALVENSSDGVVILDHQGVVRYGSPATARLLGWRPEELLGRSAFDLGYGGDHALMRERVAEATRHPGQPVEATARILCRDGSFRLFDCVVTDRSSEPSVSGLVVNYRDVTDRRRAEDDLRLRDRAIEHISQALVIIDALDTRRPIVHVNRGFERITGYAAAQAIGRNARFLAGPETDPAALDLLSRAIVEGRTGAGDVVIYRRDGAPVWCNVAVTPVAAPDGRITHFVGLGTDITARRRLEEQYRQAQKMEAVGRLAGGIAHDFNNLLSVILGYADVALRRLGPHDATRTKIEEIAKAGHRAAALTRQLLAFGRKQVLNPTPLDLGGVAADIGPMLRRLIGEDVTLCLEVQPDLGVVKADRGQIEQVVLNLAVNARDAMPQGGKLVIGCENVHLVDPAAAANGEVPPGEYVALTVTDSGVGMDAETRSRVFEPFFTTKGVGKGTGLGLATAYGVVEQSGGFIAVCSTPGQGSTFTVYLPRVDEPVEARRERPAPALPRGQETVLLVEDEDAVRALAAEVLADLGYRVLEAAGGQTALDLAARAGEGIDAVVTDVIMPGMSGRELVARLGARVKGRVLYMSGHSEDAIARHGVLDEGTTFIQKPFTPATFARAVRDLLDARLVAR